VSAQSTTADPCADRRSPASKRVQPDDPSRGTAMAEKSDARGVPRNRLRRDSSSFLVVVVVRIDRDLPQVTVGRLKEPARLSDGL
jgi:hypothetical protein